MNTGQMAAEVIRKIQDSSYTSRDVRVAINEGYDEVCAQYEIPMLQKRERVLAKANTSYATLPTTYRHSVYKAANLTINDPVNILASRRELERKYEEVHEETGNVRDCAVEGKRLYYRNVPEGDEYLDVWFYGPPPDITASAESPALFPTHLHRKLLVYWACAHFFEEIEDDVESDRGNTKWYLTRHDEGLARLRDWYPQPSMQHFDRATEYTFF